jgi:hypothetical protein
MMGSDLGVSGGMALMGLEYAGIGLEWRMFVKFGEGRVKITSSKAPPTTGEVGAWVLLKACVRERFAAPPLPPLSNAGKKKDAEATVPGVVFVRAELSIWPELALFLRTNAGV